MLRSNRPRWLLTQSDAQVLRAFSQEDLTLPELTALARLTFTDARRRVDHLASRHLIEVIDHGVLRLTSDGEQARAGIVAAGSRPGVFGEVRILPDEPVAEDRETRAVSGASAIDESSPYGS
jgi:hypothetical protein